MNRLCRVGRLGTVRFAKGRVGLPTRPRHVDGPQEACDNASIDGDGGWSRGYDGADRYTWRSTLACRGVCCSRNVTWQSIGNAEMDIDFWEEVERSRRMTPEQRFRGTLDMIDLVHELRMAGIRHDLPARTIPKCLRFFANGWKLPRIWARFDESRASASPCAGEPGVRGKAFPAIAADGSGALAREPFVMPLRFARPPLHFSRFRTSFHGPHRTRR